MPAAAPLAAPKSAPLALLRSRLNRLRRKRQAVRWGIAGATAGVIILLTLAALFGVDYLARLNRPQRAVLIVAAAAFVLWAGRRFVWPWLAVRESETDVALLVEKQQGLEGDLVAALQFTGPEAARWGSPQLEGAVVGYVDEATRELPLTEGFVWKPLPSRLAEAGLLAAVALAAALIFPQYAEVFFERLTLANVGYPTRTVITSLAINGHEIDLEDTTPLRPAGQPLTFAVGTSGERPATGVLRLTSGGGAATEVTLSPPDRGTGGQETGDGQAEDGAAAAVAAPIVAGQFGGTLEELTESVTFTARLGDAETAPRRIELVPPPSVAVDLKPTPPAYARAAAPPAPPAGTRTAFVLQGSDVAVVVRANKPLASAALSTGKQSFPLEPNADKTAWTLAPTGSLRDVSEAVAFMVNVVDEDGLSPPQPISGTIRLRPDRPPRVAAAAAVRRVIPSAKPTVSYGASDDFGIKSLRAKVRVSRVDGTSQDRTLALPFDKTKTAEGVRGVLPLDLAGFALKKGDKLTVTVEAEDARGDRPGQTASAEPLTFDVTDRAGLLAGLLEADEEGASRLDAIIQRELGIGTGK